MKKLLSAVVVSGVLALSPTVVQAADSSGAATPTTIVTNAVTTASQGGKALLRVLVRTGGLSKTTAARKADPRDGSLRINVRIIKKGEVKQKFVMVRRVNVGQDYTFATRTLLRKGTYKVTYIFRPDPENRFGKSRTNATIEVR